MTTINYDQVKKPFNKRAFISNGMFLSGLLLPFSGFMNHKLQLDQISGSRHFWMSVHNMAAILFCVFVIIHISYNWKALITYISKAKNLKISKEAITALFIVILIVGLFSSHAFHVG